MIWMDFYVEANEVDRLNLFFMLEVSLHKFQREKLFMAYYLLLPQQFLLQRVKADMAFIMHSLSWLASNGTAAIVCFPGIMYRGGAEQKIRKYLMDNNYVDCIIQ